MCDLLKKVHEHQRSSLNHFSDDYRIGLINIIKAELMVETENKLKSEAFDNGQFFNVACKAMIALEEIREIYAGMDGLLPETAPEAYQERIIRQMYECAANGIKA